MSQKSVSLHIPDVDLFKSISTRLAVRVSLHTNVVGVATAGISLATSVALSLNLPFGYVRSEVKDHGTQKIIEGLENKERPITLIEDVVSTGGTVVDAVLDLREAGFKVDKVLCIVSRNLGGEQKLRDIGVEFESLANF